MPSWAGPAIDFAAASPAGHNAGHPPAQSGVGLAAPTSADKRTVAVATPLSGPTAASRRPDQGSYTARPMSNSGSGSGRCASYGPSNPKAPVPAAAHRVGSHDGSAVGRRDISAMNMSPLARAGMPGGPRGTLSASPRPVSVQDRIRFFGNGAR